MKIIFFNVKKYTYKAFHLTHLTLITIYVKEVNFVLNKTIKVLGFKRLVITVTAKRTVDWILWFGVNVIDLLLTTRSC